MAHTTNKGIGTINQNNVAPVNVIVSTKTTPFTRFIMNPSERGYYLDNLGSRGLKIY
jgi:hypothetical protein